MWFQVLLLSVVDNSAFSLKKLSVLLISSREEPYGLSCMLVLPHTLPGVALAIVLALT